MVNKLKTKTKMSDKVIVLRETYEDQEEIIETLKFDKLPKELQKNIFHAMEHSNSDMNIEQNAIGTLQWLYDQPHRDEYYHAKGECNIIGNVTFRTNV
jgi:hypothetical protein